MYWGRIAMKINMNAGRTHTYNSKCVINCCCVSFECHWVSKGCTFGKGLGWKGGQDWHTYSNWIYKLKQRLWRASSSWDKVSKIVHHKDIPCLLTCTVHVHWISESSNEWHIQNSHNTKPGLNLWIMEYLTTNLQIIKKKNHIQIYHIFLQEYRQQYESGEGWSLRHRRSLLSALSRSLSPGKWPHYSDSSLEPHRQLCKAGRRSFQSRGRLGRK